MSNTVTLPSYLIDRDGDTYAKVEGYDDVYELTSCVCDNTCAQGLRLSYEEMVSDGLFNEHKVADQEAKIEEIAQAVSRTLVAPVANLGGGMIAMPAHELEAFLASRSLI